MAERLAGHLEEHWAAYLWLGAVLLAGLLVGSQAPRWLSTEAGENLAGLVEQLVAAAPGQGGSWRACGECLLFNGGLAAAIWFLGLSVLGSPGAVVLLFYKGFSLTFGVSMLLEAAGARGFVLSLVTVLPSSLLLLPLFVAAVRLALRFASACLQKRSRLPYALAVAEYNKSCGWLIPWLVVAALIQGWAAPTLLQGILTLI